MATNQIRPSGRRNASTPPDQRYFTLQQAISALPLVERVVRDINAQYRDLLQIQSQISTTDDDDDGEMDDAQVELRRTQDNAVRRLREYMEELNAIGCQLKDPERGTIDFCARHEGRMVYLCWQLGEQTITHWHEVNAGFTGRKPIPANFDAGSVTPPQVVAE